MAAKAVFNGYVILLTFFVCAGNVGGQITFQTTNASTWRDGKSQCRSLGMRLAIIEDNVTYSALNFYLSGLKLDTYWIGLQWNPAERTFLWLGGRRLQSFTDWFQGEPNCMTNNTLVTESFMCSISDENCVLVQHKFGWKTEPCQTQLSALCMMAKNDESTTDTTEIAMYTTASKVENEHIDEDGNIYHDSDADIVGRGEQTLLPITSPQQTSKKDDEAMTTEIYYAQSDTAYSTLRDNLFSTHKPKVIDHGNIDVSVDSGPGRNLGSGFTGTTNAFTSLKGTSKKDETPTSTTKNFEKEILSTEATNEDHLVKSQSTLTKYFREDNTTAVTGETKLRGYDGTPTRTVTVEREQTTEHQKLSTNSRYVDNSIKTTTSSIDHTRFNDQTIVVDINQSSFVSDDVDNGSTTKSVPFADDNNNSTCYCDCQPNPNGGKNPEVLAIENLYKVDKKKTRSFIRSRTSAYDGRISSRIIGCTGALIIATVLLAVVFLDLNQVVKCKKS